MSDLEQRIYEQEGQIEALTAIVRYLINKLNLPEGEKEMLPIIIGGPSGLTQARVTRGSSMPFIDGRDTAKGKGFEFVKRSVLDRHLPE